MMEIILMALNVCSLCTYNDKKCNIIQLHEDFIKDTQVYVFLNGIKFKNKKEVQVCRKCLMHLFYLKIFIDACDRYAVSIENKELAVENSEIKREDVKTIKLFAQETKDKILTIGLGIGHPFSKRKSNNIRPIFAIFQYSSKIEFFDEYFEYFNQI